MKKAALEQGEIATCARVLPITAPGAGMVPRRALLALLSPAQLLR